MLTLGRNFLKKAITALADAFLWIIKSIQVKCRVI